MTSQNKLKFQKKKNGIILIELFYLSAYYVSFRIKIFMFFFIFLRGHKLSPKNVFLWWTVININSVFIFIKNNVYFCFSF